MASIPMAVSRQQQTDGSVLLSAESCTFLFQRLRPGVLLITIKGLDRGQFGPAPVDEVAAEFSRTTQPVQVFVDTRQATGPSREVMETWTEWFAANRSRLERVVVLVSPESQLLHLTVSIVQHLSRTGGLIRICGDVQGFRRHLSKRFRALIGRCKGCGRQASQASAIDSICATSSDVKSKSKLSRSARM